MKTSNYLLGLCLVGFLSINSFASGTKTEKETENVVLNLKIEKLLTAYEIETPITGIAIVHYKVNESGVIQILEVEANSKSTSNYVYKHLDNKKLKDSDGLSTGEHILKIKFKNVVNNSF